MLIKNSKLKYLACTSDEMLFMYTKNNKVPIILPCGTPEITGRIVSDNMLLKKTPAELVL